VYPNPASDKVNIKVATGLSAGKINIQLVNMFGNVVLERSITVQKEGGFQDNLSVAGLAAGIYQLRFADGKILYSEKLVVIK
jgi:5-hydroxyisourate hydrolase-like protein (transthyretin family)